MIQGLHIYVRVSTEIQMNEGSGLQNQIDQGVKVAKNLGFNPIIHNDGSRSSSSDDITERPVLSKLLSHNAISKVTAKRSGRSMI